MRTKKRRSQTMQLLDKGLDPSEVARRVKVARQAVARCASSACQQSAESLKKSGWAGRKPA
jgi:hypothetical protein